MLQHDFPVILKTIYPWWLGIFCQDICESWNCILKRFSNHHTHRGGGRGLTVKREVLVLTRVLECAFIYSHSHIVANGFPWSGGCTNVQASRKRVGRALLCNLERPKLLNVRQDWGIEISGTDELPVDWYNPEARLVGRSAVRQTGSIAQHAAQPEVSTTPANPEIRAATVASWRDQQASALAAGITEKGPSNIEVCIASIQKISFDRN